MGGQNNERYWMVKSELRLDLAVFLKDGGDQWFGSHTEDLDRHHLPLSV